MNYTDLIKTNGGFSLDAHGNSPKTGFMVSINIHEEKFSKWDEKTIKEYVANHQPFLIVKDSFIGGWVKDGVLFMDVSLNIQDIESAMRIGKAQKQIAIYDVVTGDDIYLN